MALDQSLLERIAQSLRTGRSSHLPGAAEPPAPSSNTQEERIGAKSEARPGSKRASILARAADLYGQKRGTEDTPPTGFDPAAAALFEALVEGAFLVANADGDFDDEERAAFAEVVLAATERRVSGGQLTALLSDLEALLGEDGHDKRVDFVTKTVAKPEAQREVLRVAALIAQISGGISSVERTTLDRLASGFGLPAGSVDEAVREAQGVLSQS